MYSLMRVFGFILAASSAGYVCAGQSVKVPQTSDQQAEVLYVLHCAGCHQLDGSGTLPEVPNLYQLGGLLAHQGGRDYLIRVPGVAQSPASDEQLTLIMNWVLQRFSRDKLPATFEPFSVAEVRAGRRQVISDPVTVRAQFR